MLLGTKDDNVEVSLYFLKENSCLVDELYGDNLIDCEDLISDNLKNISIYHKYIKNPEEFLENNKVLTDLYKLLKICYYLQDVNINKVSSKIIEIINESDLSIQKSYSYLDLFYNYGLQWSTLKLMLLIVSKYGLDPFLEIVNEDGDTELNRYIIKELSNI